MTGIAITLATREDGEAVSRIEKLIGHKIPRAGQPQGTPAKDEEAQPAPEQPKAKARPPRRAERAPKAAAAEPAREQRPEKRPEQRSEQRPEKKTRAAPERSGHWRTLWCPSRRAV